MLPDSMIWHSPISLEHLNTITSGGLAGLLGIAYTDVGDDYLTARMPVTPRVHQPLGLLHGGASCALAETLGSVGGWLTLDPEAAICVGLEINANHVRAVRSGYIEGTARPLHLGKTTQVWEIRIVDEEQRLVCISRLTLAVRAMTGGI